MTQIMFLWGVGIALFVTSFRNANRSLRVESKGVLHVIIIFLGRKLPCNNTHLSKRQPEGKLKLCHRSADINDTRSRELTHVTVKNIRPHGYLLGYG